MQQPATSPVSALPSPAARLLAFVAILIAGVCGGLIGWSVTDLQCGDDRVVEIPAGQPAGETATTTTTLAEDDDDDSGCAVAAGLGGLVGAAIGAGGTAVIAVLVLRAMGEWRRTLDEQDAPPEP